MNCEITHILFDLGRVLINLPGPPPLRDEWLPQALSVEEKWRRWGECPVVIAYESGKISAEEFIDGMLAYFNLSVGGAQFREAFVDWPAGFLPGAQDLLRQLKPRYTLAFYSNTSDLHLPRFMNTIGLAQYFDFAFASYEIGHYKPDPEGFRIVQQRMAVANEHILFIDDMPANVASAVSVGMHAEQALGVDQVKQVLRRYACID
ncbi:MAG: HAD family phosphatase [Cellvibrionaceae bacterium]|nr:HAD family phosphatase [Cellvibrionaceae bacterium]